QPRQRAASSGSNRRCQERTPLPQSAIDSPARQSHAEEVTMGFYSRAVLPLLCDFGLNRPFVAKHRRELLAGAGGRILEIGFGTGLNVPHYPSGVRSLTVVEPNVGM